MELKYPKRDNVKSKWFATEFAIDFFSGMLIGDFPYHSIDIYMADVASVKVQGSVNLTLSWKLQIFDMMKFNIEFDLAPIVGTLAMDAYSTSVLGDNCFWLYYNYHLMNFNTKLSKQFK